MLYFILVIPSCCGEIMDYGYIVDDKSDINEEAICYEFIIEDNKIVSFQELD